MVWVTFTIIAALLTAIIIILEKKTLIKEHSLPYASLLNIFLLLILLFFISQIDIKSLPIWMILLTYVVSWIFTLAFWFYKKGLKHLNISLVSPLSNFSPVFIIILSVLIFFLIIVMLFLNTRAV